ncbi:MAG TPA: hypothetical protein VGF45_07295 [Polyangia bacterium]
MTAVNTDDASEPLMPGELRPQPLFYVADEKLEVTDIGLTSEHLYFSVEWQGVYRMPKHGGAVEVVDAGAKNSFRHLSIVRDDVFWPRTRFGERDRASVEVKHRPTASGPNVLAFSGEWSMHSNHGHFQADASGIFFVGSSSGSVFLGLWQVATTGGPPTSLLSFEEPWRVPGWKRDAGRIFFATPLLTVSRSTAVSVLVDGQTEPRLLATLPAGSARLHDTDAGFLYLSDSKTVWRVGKDDGVVAEVVTGEVVRSLLVDDARIYLAASLETGGWLNSIDKSDGLRRRVGSGSAFRGLRQLVQDDHHIYSLHDHGHRVSVVAKAPSQ